MMLFAAALLVGVIGLFLIVAATRPVYDAAKPASRVTPASEDELRARGDDFEYFHSKYDPPAHTPEELRREWNRAHGRTAQELESDKC